MPKKKYTKEETRAYNELRKKGCLGKIKHKYMTSAEYVLEEMVGDDLNIYKCEYCGFFHIGGGIKNE